MLNDLAPKPQKVYVLVPLASLSHTAEQVEGVKKRNKMHDEGRSGLLFYRRDRAFLWAADPQREQLMRSAHKKLTSNAASKESVS